MATEVAAVETPEVVEDRTEEKAPEPVEEGYDASLLVFVKGKAKRPARPDDAERNIQVQKLQEQIDKASARITEIKAILDSRGSSRGVVSPEVQAGRDKIQQLRAEFDTVLVQKKRLMSQNDDKKTERDKLFAEQRSIRDTIKGPSNLQAVEEAIARMEYELTHESLSAEREKMLREKKERAEKHDRPAAMRLAQVSAKIDEAKRESEAIRSDIAVLNTRLDRIKAAREEEEAKLNEIRQAQQDARSDIPALNVEKKELFEVINALRDKQREIRTAFQAKWDEFKKVDRAWKGWFAEERKKRNEQRHQEYLERQAARAARDDVVKPKKFEHEVYTCEQVLSYLRQFVVVEKAAVEEKKPVDAPAPGMKLMNKKTLDEEADALWGSVQKKGKGKGARKAAEKQKAAEAVKQLPKVLPLETLKTFHELGVEPPATNEDVPKTIAALEAKKKEYEEKRDKAAAEPPSEDEPEPEEAAAETAEAADGDKEAEGVEDKAEEAAEETAEKAAEDKAEEKAVEEKAAEEKVEEKAEANGHDAEGDASEEGDAEAKITPSPTKGKTADGDVGVKLRVSDAGEVSVEVTA